MSPLILRDRLALDRTHLANERTFLAYFRTFLVLISSGIAIMKLESLSDIHGLGLLLTVISPIILFVGIGRLYYVKRKIRRYYRDLEE